MYRPILFLIALASLSTLNAQSWAPVSAEIRYDFKRTSEDFVQHIIEVENFAVAGTDTTFTLALWAAPCNTCPTTGTSPCDLDFRHFPGKPQFLMRTATHLGSGVYQFSDTATFIIHSRAKLGDMWSFNATTNAEVTNVDTQTVLGTLDSVKEISLSSGFQIILSKSNGFVRFPDFFGIDYYELTGSVGSDIKGNPFPTWRELFLVEKGSRYEYKEKICDESGMCAIIYNRIKQFTVDSVWEDLDKVYWKVHGAIKLEREETIYPATIEHFTFESIWEIDDIKLNWPSMGDNFYFELTPLDEMNNVGAENPLSWFYQFGTGKFAEGTFMFNRFKQFPGERPFITNFEWLDENSSCLAYGLDSDVLLSYFNDTVALYPSSLELVPLVKLEKGIGVLFYGRIGTTSEEHELVAFSNSTISFGTFSDTTSWPLFANSIPTPNIEVHPTLSAGYFQISTKIPVHGYRVFNLNGTTVKEYTALSNQNIFLENLASGMYILELHTPEGIARKKILIQ